MFFIVGPCALESLTQVKPIASLCERYGIKYFRSQLFKPRTHHSSFQGLGADAEGMEIINYLKSKNFSIVSEALSIEQLIIIREFASIIQIGARSMQNFELLKKIGPLVHKRRDSHNQTISPFVLLKRGPSNTEEEWLAAASYLEAYGVPRSKIILCERGTRNHVAPKGVTIDFGLAYRVKNATTYKVIIDPSHGTRDANLVLPMLKATIAMGFDGAMIEVHPTPNESLSDRDQTVSLEEFEKFLNNNDLSPFVLSKHIINNHTHRPMFQNTKEMSGSELHA
ncbi:MAG: 3-deoxy-7-phosphoheptulonate synthase [Oligoflexia bacterium]|nr:3-deoxy-7-phosphoheptulonate synthase [Oligoflexia bacterium]